ncbi:MAG: sugar ABC transporter permease [Chloroflexales bacterium]|nr:sugar ABC transporter permease [Chloroflexales bacterium]
MRHPSAASHHKGLSDRSLALLLVLPAALLLGVFSIYPFLQAAFDSLFHLPLATRQGSFVGLANYLQVFQDARISRAFGRTLLWTASNIVVQTGLGLLIALLLNARLYGRTLARGLVLFPYMVPAIVVATVFRFTFNDITGIASYLWLKLPGVHEPIYFLSQPGSALLTVTIVNCWKYTPFIVIVLLARLQTVPRDLYEAAQIDGAGRLSLLRHVTLPWLLPVLLVALLLRTIWTVNDFDVIYLLAFGGPLDATTTLPLEIRRLAFGQQDLGLASALAVVVALGISVIALAYLWLYRRAEARLHEA